MRYVSTSRVGGVFRYSMMTGSMPALRIIASVLRDVRPIRIVIDRDAHTPCPLVLLFASYQCCDRLDDPDDQQHDRYLDQYADHRGQRPHLNEKPNKLIAVATASSKKLLAPIRLDGPATQCATPSRRFNK